MSDPAEMLDPFRRYAAILRRCLSDPAPFVAHAESASAVRVERGVVFPAALVGSPLQADATDRLIELSSSERLAETAVVDRAGHHRPVYRALLVYCWLQAFSLRYETLSREQFGRWEEALRLWCDLLESDLSQVAWPAGAMPAARGSSATEAAFAALALHVAGKVFVRDVWTDLASDSFGRIARSQTPAGPFLAAGAGDNPETHWYHELVVLHAAASYAVQAEDRTIAAAVARNAEFHQSETQPDHATTQPWALFAFLWNPPTRPLAEQILHSATVQNPNGIDGVSLMLLADALYCIELFTK